MGCSPWGHKRVKCGLATKQQQQFARGCCLQTCYSPPGDGAEATTGVSGKQWTQPWLEERSEWGTSNSAVDGRTQKDLTQRVSQADATLAEFLEDVVRDGSLPALDSATPLISLSGWFRIRNFL